MLRFTLISSQSGVNMRICEICKKRPAMKSGTIYKGKQYWGRKCWNCKKNFPGKRSMEERFWAKVNKTDGCWEWTAGFFGCGYPAIGIATSKLVSAHRYSWELHNGPIPDGAFVLHKCDNPKCVRPDHLQIGDQAENMRQMVSRGRARNGATGRLNQKSDKQDSDGP